jgi:predicted peptidase
MRIRSLLVIVTTLAVSCSGPVGAIPTSVHLQGNFEDASGTEMRYLVWLPDGYGDDREAIHPMIVFLHGSGSDTYDSEFVIAMGLPAVLAQGEQPENFDFVVIAPQAAPGSSWGVGEQLDVVDRLVAEVVDTYLVDPEDP